MVRRILRSKYAKNAISLITKLIKGKKYVKQPTNNMKRNKMDHRRSEPEGCGYAVERTPSTLSVSAVDYMMTLPVTCPPSPAISNVTLTPGRTRNIDQDMEALRISRQDNPFLQQVIASRESLVDCLEESESDNATLMSQEFPTDLGVDPLTLPEIHEHMIRSPPPTTWPRSPNFKIFRFPDSSDDDTPQEKEIKSSFNTSPMRLSRISLGDSVGKTVSRTHNHHHSERFSLLNPTPIRSLSDVRRISTPEDSVQLMSSSDE